jgi:hypothetical protein
MEKFVWSIILGPLAGLVISLTLLPFGINQAEWLMTLGAAIALFIVLLVSDDSDNRATEKTEPIDHHHPTT